MFWKKCGNAGNYQICGISRTIAGWLTPMSSSIVSGSLGASTNVPDVTDVEFVVVKYCGVYFDKKSPPGLQVFTVTALVAFTTFETAYSVSLTVA